MNDLIINRCDCYVGETFVRALYSMQLCLFVSLSEKKKIIRPNLS